MNQHSPLYFSKLYRDFCSLDVHTPRGVVYFYEKNEKAIADLDLQEYFDVLVQYVEALYSCEEYETHILMSEVVLETSIYHNIVMHRNEDIFQKILFRKACSYYHLGAYKGASSILRQLCQINPGVTAYEKLLKQSIRLETGDAMQTVRAATIFCFLLASLVTLSEVLVIRNFFVQFQQPAEYLRITLFTAGIFGLLYRFVDNYRNQPIEWEEIHNAYAHHTIPDN